MARVPLTATPNRESRGCLPQLGRWREAPEGLTDRTRPPCESRAAPSSPSGETLRTECGNSVRSTATLRAGAQLKRPKSAKGVWVGETNEVCLRNVRVFPHKQHIKSSRDYPPKQSGGLFRKHSAQLNYSLPPNIITIAISSIYMIHKFVPRYYRYLYKIINFT